MAAIPRSERDPNSDRDSEPHVYGSLSATSLPSTISLCNLSTEVLNMLKGVVRSYGQENSA